MSNPSALGAVEYEAESSWAEDVTTFATHRLPVLGAIDTSGLTHDKMAPERVVQYRNDGTQWILGTQGGSFKTKIHLAGHGATTAGSPTLDALETWLGIAIGNVALSASASTTLTGGTAAVPTTTASGTFSAGGACRVGSLGDGRGGGQLYAITTHTTTSLTLRGALGGAPTNGDVLYPVAQIYPSESPTAATVSSTRMRVLTGNLCYELHGCFPTALSITGLNPGEIPMAEITWGVSWWRYSTGTFPSTVTSNQYSPAPIAAGSLNVQVVGTTTRSTRTYRSMSLDWTLGIEPLVGPGGVNQYQKIVGARRTPDKVKLTWTEDADTATTTPILPGFGTGTSVYHIEFTGSAVAGSAVGFTAPRACVTNVAIQKADGNINRLTIEAELYTSTVSTSALTLANIVWCMG